MQFEVNLKNFSDIVGLITKNISSNPANPVLSGLKLEATEKGLYLTGGNENMMIEACISDDSVEIFEAGEFLVPAKHFAAILKKLSTETVEIETDVNVINIKSGNTEVKLNGMDTEQYPRFPQNKGRKCFELEGEKLKEIIKQIAFATAKHETRPGLTGTLIQISDGQLKFVATDSHRLAQLKTVIEGSDVDVEAIVPGKDLLETGKLLGDDEPVSIYITNSNIVCETSSMTILVRLLDANYPDTDRIIPKEFKTKVKLDTGWLLQALERVGIMAAENYNTVKMQVKAQSLFVSSLAPEYGMAGEEVIIESMEGEEMTIHFNVKYLIEALRAIGERTVEFGFNGSLAPFSISPADCEDQEEYLHLIVPVRPATA